MISPIATLQMTSKGRTALTALVVLMGAAVLLLGLRLSRPMHGKWYLHERAQHDLFVLTDVLDQYHQKHGAYPGTDQGLQPLVAEGHLRRIPTDPWGNDYRYNSPGAHNPGRYDLWSNGADGREGGDGLDTDVKNWIGD
ncbi:MAG: type II secretion system protein GspG [Candidatus Polarisedimenticolia bacterium]